MGRTFSINAGLVTMLSSVRPNGFHLPVKQSIPTDANPSADKLIFRPALPNDRDTKDWTAMAWPTNIQSVAPDGKFGPARMRKGFGDCWFMAALAAVVDNPGGHSILAESIKQGQGGYDVTFRGVPHNSVFISWGELQKCLDNNGGDADTRLFELAACKFFNKSGSYKSLYIAATMSAGWNQAEAEECFKEFCQKKGRQDPMTYNPMRSGCSPYYAFFMFTGLPPKTVIAASGSKKQKRDVMRFLDQHVTKARDGVSIAMMRLENPLGNSAASRDLVIAWDVIRTEITSQKPMALQQQVFLKALDKWLETGSPNDLEALRSAAGNLNLQHVNLVAFVNMLIQNQFKMNQDHFNLLRSGVQEVLKGGFGYIGLPGGHCGTLLGIDKKKNTFTYSEPNYPTVVHIGELSDLIEVVRSSDVLLTALDPITGKADSERFEHVGTSRGRHLSEIHDQVVKDKKIDPAEIGPLANLLEMDAGAFRQVYDNDQNGVIEGSELKTVKQRVDRWVDYFELTPFLV